MGKTVGYSNTPLLSFQFLGGLIAPASVSVIKHLFCQMARESRSDDVLLRSALASDGLGCGVCFLSTVMILGGVFGALAVFVWWAPRWLAFDEAAALIHEAELR